MSGTTAQLTHRAREEFGTARSPYAILAVDDAAARGQCLAALEAHGFVVQVEPDAEHAFRAARAANDPVVVCDAIALPAGDTTRATGAHGVNSWPIPTVLVCDETTACELLKADPDGGLCEIVLTPVRSAEMILRIRSLRCRARMADLLGNSNAARGDQARILDTIHEHLIQLVSLEDMADALGTVASFAQQLLHVGEVTVWLPDGPRLRAAHTLGPPTAASTGVWISLDDGWLGRTFSAGEPLLIECAEQLNFRPSASERNAFRNFPLLLIPLRAGGLTVGVLSVAQRAGERPFGPLEQECAGLLGGIAGTVVRQIVVRQSRDAARDMIVFALAKLAEYRDNETGRHLERVTRFSLMLADELQHSGPYRQGIDAVFTYCLERAAPLHDIGKVAVPDSILLKAGRLTEQEMSVMKTHPETGWRAIASVTEQLSRIPFLQMAGEVAYAHHERFDGQGYPRRLSGEDIPLAARIVSVADVYDALTTVRPYKSAYPHEKACAIIEEGLGSQFDPVVGAAFRARTLEFARTARELADVPSAQTLDDKTLVL